MNVHLEFYLADVDPCPLQILVLHLFDQAGVLVLCQPFLQVDSAAHSRVSWNCSDYGGTADRDPIPVTLLDERLVGRVVAGNQGVPQELEQGRVDLNRNLNKITYKEL